MRELKKTPARFCEDGRVAEWGAFASPFTELNIHDVRVPGVPGFLTKYRLKEWQHFAVVGEDFLFAFVVFTSHYLSPSFCYFVDLKTGEMVEHHREVPGGHSKVSRELFNDRCLFAKPGYRVEVKNRLAANRHEAVIDIAKTKKLPAIRAKIEMHADLAAIQPLVVCLPISENRPLFTHKMLCPAAGRIEVGERTVDLDPARCHALIDVQKTFYPYDTLWRWATFAGIDAQGRRIGINLVQNMIEDDTTYNENAFWCDGKQSLLGAARFSLDLANVLAPWSIETTDGRCRLAFTPQGERADRINLGVILSDYHQPFGRFTGEVTDDAGEVHAIDGCLGVTEFHKARF